MPQLSAAQGREDDAPATRRMLDWGLRLVLLLALPCAVALLVFAEPLVATLFHRGAFDALRRAADRRARCAATASAWSAWSASRSWRPASTPRQDMRTPVTIAVVRAGADPADEPAASCRCLGHAGAGAVDRPRRAGQRRCWLFVGLTRARQLPAGAGLGPLRAAGAVRQRAARRAARRGRAATSTGSACRPRRLQRIGLLAACLAGAALLYFGACWRAGLKLRSFCAR